MTTGRFRLILLSSLLAVLIACGADRAPTPIRLAPPPSTAVAIDRGPTDAEPKDIIPYLASTELQGRGIGMAGLDRAADLIAADFRRAGLSPIPGQKDYFQEFSYTAHISAGADTALSLDGKALNLNDDFTSFSFSAPIQFAGDVVYAGYGISAPESGYDDYAGLDVKGKVVLAMRYEPIDEHQKSRLVRPGDEAPWSGHATFGAKAKAAADHGAVALLIVTPPPPITATRPTTMPRIDPLSPFASSFAAEPVSIAVMHIRQAAAQYLLKASGAPDLQQLKSDIDSKFSPHSMLLNAAKASGKITIDRMVARLKNVMAILPGQGPHADEYVVVGGHYDHLGLGRQGNQFGPVGSIYPGADDNASGTATVIELATSFAKGPPPQRSLLFICFSAEEEGLVGSEYFVKHPLVPLNKIVAMLNLDMVGRLKDEILYVGGAGTAPDFDSILDASNKGLPLQLKSIGRGGLGPSDHMSFALKRVPVLFFFTGLHEDYHRPTDTADKINYAGIEQVATLSQRVVDGMAHMPRQDYRADADKDSMTVLGFGPSADAPTRKVILGIIPDFSSEDSHAGVLISGTTPGTPAAAADLRAGDLIVQFGPQKLDNLMDLTQALAGAKPGDSVHLKVLRDKQTLNLDVTLAERKGSQP